MLVLTRKVGEKIVIGDDPIEIVVLSINGSYIKIGIKAPKELSIDREEIWIVKKDRDKLLKDY